jgi:O-acetyl-ADP-ribose deacetylase
VTFDWGSRLKIRDRFEPPANGALKIVAFAHSSGKFKLGLFRGDITTLKADAIVNAANNELVLGGGVSGAIRRSGGHAVESALRKIKVPIALGEAVVTPGGDLPARYVIHAASLGRGIPVTPRSLEDSIVNSLKRANELKLASIAFPSIGTGTGRFPAIEAAKIAVPTVIAELEKGSSLKMVIFALFGETYNIFEKEIRSDMRR